ncbi:MAG: beta-ketoacyl-[acyl-carrier-protein] synthase family protein [Thermaerobacter sp.]|nr:beta-ketoacyl-[acyl-carrier-protein] synthase family protein [Thermaerobacter sp.]
MVVTGMGAITPLGVGVEALWRGVLDGRTGVRRLDGMFGLAGPALGAPVHEVPVDGVLPLAEIRHYDRFIHLALVAAQEAVTASGVLESADPEAVGVYIGCALGGIETLSADTIAHAGGARVGPRLLPKTIPNMAAATIAEHWGLRGPNLTFSTACSASNNAIGEAFLAVASGRVDVCIAGGAESLFAAVVMSGLDAARALSRRYGDPLTASRPFSEGRDGMVMGEGAGILVLESEAHAARRNANVLGRVTGYGPSSDAHHPTQPHPEGRGAELAMRRALASAGLDPKDIDYINAHGTSTPIGDEVECKAVQRVFGNRPPVSSQKGAIGHLLGAAGAAEAVITLCALAQGVVPPTVNYQGGGPEGFDFVPTPRPAQLKRALSNSFGFGGQNASVVLERA